LQATSALLPFSIGKRRENQSGVHPSIARLQSFLELRDAP
jgi:hypothetical protein